jgi:hypothetical protein
MIIAATLTPHAIVADTHPLVIGADTLRGGFVEDIGETVERYRHGLDDAGKIEIGDSWRHPAWKRRRTMGGSSGYS